MSEEKKESTTKLAGDIKLSWPTKFAYAGGDVACNIVFGMVGSVLTLFYTDYAGINPAIVGVVFLIARVFDGITDLAMGFIVERTNSRWGKARPWLLWMSIPFSVSAVLLFTVPQTTQSFAAIYVFVTYFFCNTICYTAVNLPYGSLSSMMTRNAQERQSLSVVRMGLSPLGKIISVTFTLPLVGIFGGTQTAWIITISIWAVIGEILLLLCFFKCKENVVVPGRGSKEERKKNNVPILKGLSALVRNQYFWAVLVLWMFQSVSFSISGTMLPYYTKYFLQLDNADWMYSLLFLTETLTLVACIFICAPLVKKYGKRNVALVGAFIALAGQLILLIDNHSLPILFATCVLRGIGLAPLNAVVFGMVGDAVEFGQWKTHVRQEGLVFAGGSIGTKVGAGVTSALITSLLAAAGYVTSTAGFATQPQAALDMIYMIYLIGPLIIAVGAILVLSLYQLDKKYDKIAAELAQREARGEL